mgnify:CR=1 FL=1
MTLNEWLAITIGAILVNNMVLARILGICPFLGVSKKLSTALGMSGALIFVMTIASFVASVLYNCLLKVKLSVPALGLQNVDIGFTKLLLFIVVIAALVQIVEIVMQKFLNKSVELLFYQSKVKCYLLAYKWQPFTWSLTIPIACI